MKRSLFLCLAIAVFTFGVSADAPSPVSRKILAPAASSSTLLHAKAVISRIRARDNAKKLPERLVLAVGKREMEISVDIATIVKNTKGKIVSLAKLKKGERVNVVYRTLGKRAHATSITILS